MIIKIILYIICALLATMSSVGIIILEDPGARGGAFLAFIFLALVAYNLIN